MKREFFIASVLALLSSNPAAADLIYTPINPSFGGDPFNSNHLQGLAASQTTFEETSGSSRQTSTERFLSMLQSRLYSSLASQVAGAIFGEDAQPNGTIIFDDQQVSFVNTGTQIQLVVTDFSTGQVTNITIPTLATE
jgi:curli production assembly/transport component CsgF